MPSRNRVAFGMDNSDDGWTTIVFHGGHERVRKHYAEEGNLHTEE